MIAAIYCRVSTDNQEREGTSLQTQMENCLTYCQSKHYDVSYRFSEAYSGLSLERPELDKLRELVRAESIDIIVCYSLDRLSRDPGHGVIITQELEKHSVKLETVTEDVDNSELGKLISYIRGYASKLEAEKIRERTMRGKKAKAKLGRIVANSHASLYGYDYIPVSQENGGRRIIKESEAEVIRHMYEWLIEGLSTNAITLKLRSLRVSTPSGKGFWIRSTVHKILTNIAYTGKTYAFTCTYVEPKYRMKADTKRKNTGIIYKPKEEWIEIPGVTPAIITTEVFQAVQMQLQENRRKAERNRKREYLLHGHVYCRQCGRSYWGGIHSSKGKVTRRYQCSGKHKIVTPVICGNKAWAADQLETLVWAELESYLSNPDLIKVQMETQCHSAGRKVEVEKELQEVYRQLKTLDREQSQLLEWALKGFPEETVVSENKKLNAMRETLKSTTVELETQLKASQEANFNLQKLKRTIELLQQQLSNNPDYETKRAFLDGMNIKVWIDGENPVDITGFVPENEENIATTPSESHLPARHRGN